MDELIYLDNGATSFPKPEEVYVFMDNFYRHYGFSPGRSGYDLCMETGKIVDDTRKIITRYFNGSNPDRLVFSHNSTDALNLAISGTLSPGDHVITSQAEHNSVLRPLYHQSSSNVTIDFVKLDNKGFIDPEDIKRSINPDTKLVVINHGSNVIGTVQPIREIGRICRDHGITFLVDASQTAGKLTIDIEAMNIDILAFTGHKSLMGPTGIGGLYVGDDVIIRHTRSGGTGVKSSQPAHLEEYPYRLEYGTLNILGIAGINAGIKWLKKKGTDNIHHHEMTLTQKIRDGLADIENVTLYCADDLKDHIGVLSFNIKGLEAVNTGTILDADYNISCRTGLHCAPLVHKHLGTDTAGGTVRIGVGPFNTMEQVGRTLQAIAKIAADYGK